MMTRCAYKPNHGKNLIAGMLAIAGPLAFGVLNAPNIRAQSAQPAFEVTSVKPNRSGDPGSSFGFGGATVTFTNQTLKNIVLNTYQIRDFQLLGGPGWINCDHFDIEGKVAGNPGLDQRRLMMQALLQDRFKLALNREVKELPIFQLTIGKNGLKLQPLKEGSCPARDPNNPKPAQGRTDQDYCGFTGFFKGRLEATSTTMAQLATYLSRLVDRTVVDKTGITGTFPVHLTFAPDQAAPGQVLGPPIDEGDPGTSTDGASIFTAIQEQLGLRLESGKGPVDVLVIDNVEKPTQN